MSKGCDRVRAVGSTAGDPLSLIYRRQMAATGNARKAVHLTQACFVPDPQLPKALTDAARRVVLCKAAASSKCAAAQTGAGGSCIFLI